MLAWAAWARQVAGRRGPIHVSMLGRACKAPADLGARAHAWQVQPASARRARTVQKGCTPQAWAAWTRQGPRATLGEDVGVACKAPASLGARAPCMRGTCLCLEGCAQPGQRRTVPWGRAPPGERRTVPAVGWWMPPLGLDPHGSNTVHCSAAAHQSGTTSMTTSMPWPWPQCQHC